MHHKDLGYYMADLKGISPSIETHRIFMEEGAQPVEDFQRKLKLGMEEVIRKEIIRLLDACINYHITESDWVSLVHCVPKKGRFISVQNEQNEEVTTRPIIGHRMCIEFRKLNK